MSEFALQLNQEHVTTRNNVMRAIFPQSLMLAENAEIALLRCYINYSWFNLTEALNNTTVSYYFPCDNSVNLVDFGPSFMLISDINNYIQGVMLKNGHYLVDENGVNVFYFSIQNNYTKYGNTCTFKPLPSTLPAGWSNPGGLDLSVPNAKTPQLVLGSNNFGKFIGFAASTSYPGTPQTITTQINSPIFPEASSTGSCLIACNMVNAPNYNKYGNIIGSFTPAVQFGSRIVVEPPQLDWYRCIGGSYPYIEIAFYDQRFAPLAINDTQIEVTVKVREK